MKMILSVDTKEEKWAEYLSNLYTSKGVSVAVVGNEVRVEAEGALERLLELAAPAMNFGDYCLQMTAKGGV